MNTTFPRSNVPRAPGAGLRPLAVRWLVVLAALALGGAALAQDATPDVADLMRDGDFYYAQGDCALAQYFFQEALKRDEAHVPALIGKGRALACQVAYGSAIEAFREAIEREPDSVPARVQLALAYQQQFLTDPATFAGRLGEALDVLTRAEQLAPGDPTVQNTKGIVYYEAGQLDQARATLERAVELAATAELSERERSVVQVNLGKTYRDLGELELAQSSFRRAVVLNPTSATAHNDLGNVAYRLGDCATAEYELSQAVALAPDSLSAVSQLAIVLFECGDVAGSVPRFERALTLDGAIFAPPLYTYLARAYLEQGRVDDAVRRAQQGALLPPESAEAHYVLGTAYLARASASDAAAARREFERALELDPGYGAARTALDALN
ncbi:MAG: tetratricopeptide repeat protein [Trueperaceae bacterium]|nr:tetratricopeptide repeat protein [Trueperaceae bacterium]